MSRRPQRTARPTGGRCDPHTLTPASALAMAMLMQALGHSLAALYEGAVWRQKQGAIAGETSAAQVRLSVYGTAPRVLVEAANRLTLDHLADTAPALLALLRGEPARDAGSPAPTPDRTPQMIHVTNERDRPFIG